VVPTSFASALQSAIHLRALGLASFLPAPEPENRVIFSSLAAAYAYQIDAIRPRWQDNKHLFILGLVYLKLSFLINKEKAGTQLARAKNADRMLTGRPGDSAVSKGVHDAVSPDVRHIGARRRDRAASPR
jgi:hypothetical protein